MAAAGYSGTPLIDKLGIKPNTRILLLGAPVNYVELLGKDVQRQLISKNETPTFIHLFVESVSQLEKHFPVIKKAAKKNPTIIIWVSWYKKAAKIPTDVTEDTIRHWALQNELVDVKVCAVNDVWSGLKLVVPLSKR